MFSMSSFISPSSQPAQMRTPNGCNTSEVRHKPHNNDSWFHVSEKDNDANHNTPDNMVMSFPGTTGLLYGNRKKSTNKKDDDELDHVIIERDHTGKETYKNVFFNIHTTGFVLLLLLFSLVLCTCFCK